MLVGCLAILGVDISKLMKLTRWRKPFEDVYPNASEGGVGINSDSEFGVLL
jgi:hypothetical protein